MIKKILVLAALFLGQTTLAAEQINLYHAPLSQINALKQSNKVTKKSIKAPGQPGSITLKALKTRKEKNQTTTRYQQLYKGIPVVGAQAIVVESTTTQNQLVNGELVNNIQMDTTPPISRADAINIAKTAYFNQKTQTAVTNESSHLQIRLNADNQPQLTYLVSFKTQAEDTPVWPFFVIEARKGTIISQWNNIKNYSDHGSGGNEKVHKYWYGQDGVPSLDTDNGTYATGCAMDNGRVRAVHLGFNWDWSSRLTLPYTYRCGSLNEDFINGAFSPLNDAYYFGNVIDAMYKKWYNVPPIQNAQGQPLPLIMRVHFGQGYENAFWDGKTMSFGDGADYFYPFVALDVAAHEVTHGFTENHSGLEYHDESGAINESLSDMAGQAARAYLLETEPAFYNKLYPTPNTVTWKIGETIIKNGEALRFMDRPSEDGFSADCYEPAMAEDAGENCSISYQDVINYADEQFYLNPEDKQSFIVHTGSGIFNKAFYLLSQEIGIKKAYRLMVTANMNYFTPTSNFTQAACGVVRAAHDLQVDSSTVRDAFSKVGVSTENCSV